MGTYQTAKSDRRNPAADTHGLSVELRAVEKIYWSQRRSPVPALSGIDLRIAPGEFVSVVGPSGCGKSTLLKLVAGLIRPSNGEITVNGSHVNRPHPELGMVFQQDVLLEWRSVLDNVLLPVEIKRLKRADYFARAQDLIKQVGLQGFEDKYPSELSGGMRQRVSLSRALIVNPGLLLMDEPFGALDALTRDQMNIDLLQVWGRVENTVLFITHAIEEAAFLSDRVAIMSSRPGRIVRILPVELDRPRNTHMRTGEQFNTLVKEIRETFESFGVLRDSQA